MRTEEDRLRTMLEAIVSRLEGLAETADAVAKQAAEELDEEMAQEARDVAVALAEVEAMMNGWRIARGELADLVFEDAAPEPREPPDPADESTENH